MSSKITTLPEADIKEITDSGIEQDKAWLVIVWNDPINLMNYVTYVLQKVFGYAEAKAHKLMLQVHEEGKAVVSSGPRDKAEIDVTKLQNYGLWATLQRSD